jgi:hypothetical protein
LLAVDEDVAAEDEELDGELDEQDKRNMEPAKIAAAMLTLTVFIDVLLSRILV